MDVISCIDWCNSCFWDAILPIILVGLIGAVAGGVITIPAVITIPFAPITIPVGAIIGTVYGLLPFLPEFGGMITGVLESLCTNIIWIISSPIIVRAAYVDGSIEAFFEAARDLIDHLL